MPSISSDSESDDTSGDAVSPNAWRRARRSRARARTVGWRAREWDDAFYEVLDVARRVGSGVGSFGVGRYYVLLRGSPTEVDDDDLEEGGAVILDVKYEPAPAVAAGKRPVLEVNKAVPN